MKWSLLPVIAALVLPAAAAEVDARPRTQKRTAKPIAPKGRAGKVVRTPQDSQKLGAFARVAIGRAEPAIAATTGRRAEPLTAEELAAAEIQKLLRGPLRRGVTGLYVADARTGDPLFAVNANDPLNPASNVKLISTAAALELLGPEFKYPTRLLGPTPDRGVVRGDVYLLGSYDPTLTVHDLDDLAAGLAARGVTAIEGSVVVGRDPTRDGVFRAIIPIDITAGEPGQPPLASTPVGFDLVEVAVTATTAKRAMKPRLTYKADVITNPAGEPRITLAIGGTIGKGDVVQYPLWTRQRTATAAYGLIAALRARSIAVSGGLRVRELGDYVGDVVGASGLPVELARHDSQAVSDIVSRINKWSVNWLADRLIMTAAALSRREQPSMSLALDAMYGWLAAHPHLPKADIVLDTGSGLSYQTRITPAELVSVVRSAAGFAAGAAGTTLTDAWRRSLSVAGTDGTLQHRFRGSELRGRIIGKTGTLSTVIAMSGILDIDPQRPLAFALVTNTDAPLAKLAVRRAHEQVIGEISKYLVKTARSLPIAAPVPAAGAADAALPEDVGEDTEASEASEPSEPGAGAGAAALDAETARSR